MKSAEEILAPYIEIPFRYTKVVDEENALKAIYEYAEQFQNLFFPNLWELHWAEKLIDKMKADFEKEYNLSIATKELPDGPVRYWIPGFATTESDTALQAIATYKEIIGYTTDEMTARFRKAREIYRTQNTDENELQ